MSSSTPKKTKTSIIIISKTGSLSECVVETDQETTIDELTTLLSKKCGYKNPDGFSCYHTWRYKNKNKNKDKGNDAAAVGAGASKYIYVDIWSKTNGRAGQENKYELPPPIDEIIFFGNMALVARIDKENAINLTLELWNKIYEKLFGGFEDLSLTVAEDDNEVDELDSIPDSQKTANGYLKDGFVVDDEEAGETPRPKRGVRGGGSAGTKLKSNPKSKANAKTKPKTKSKSESTESEFITETDTDSGTPLSLDSTSSSTSPSPSPSPSDSEGDIQPQEQVRATSAATAVNTIVKKTRAAKKQPSTTNGISKTGKKASAINGTGAKTKKPVVEEIPTTIESESELSEEEYA